MDLITLIKEVYLNLSITKLDWIILGLFFSLLNTIISPIRYTFLFKFIGEPISLWKSSLIFGSSQIANYVIPFKGGIISKPILTKMYSNATLKNATSICLFEQTADLIWQIVLIPLLLFSVGKQFITKSPFLEYGLRNT